MPITVDCPQCAVPFSVADSFLGKHIRCKLCGAVVPVGFVPAPESRPRRRKPRELGPKAPGGGVLVLILLIVLPLALILGGAVVVTGVVWWRKPKIPQGPAIPAINLPAAPDLVPAVGLNPELAWPEPPFLRGGNYGPDEIVILRISGVDAARADAIGKWLPKFVDEGHGHAFASQQSGDRMVAALAPVRDTAAFAKRINFGKVLIVLGRTVTVVADKKIAPPPNDRN